MIALNIAMTVENISKCYRIGVEEKTEKSIGKYLPQHSYQPLKKLQKIPVFL